MKKFIAFTKKEFLEQIRTYKWLIVFSVFFVFGMTSPLLAKITPDIISGMKMGGVKIKVPEPTILDAYGQYFKNLTQMGMLALLLVFGGTISNELMKGTLINILAKGLPRSTVILSKYAAAVSLWTTGFLLSAVTDYGYTVYLFRNETVKHLIYSLFCMWLFGCFVIALIFLSSTIAAGYFGGLVLSVAALMIMLMVNIIPKAVKYNPVTLASKNLALLNGTQTVNGLRITVLITLMLSILCLYLSTLLFNKKKL